MKFIIVYVTEDETAGELSTKIEHVPHTQGNIQNRRRYCLYINYSSIN